MDTIKGTTNTSLRRHADKKKTQHPYSFGCEELKSNLRHNVIAMITLIRIQLIQFDT